jgi:hypothetical protein
VKNQAKKWSFVGGIEAIQQVEKGLALSPKLFLLLSILVFNTQLSAQETNEFQNFWRKSFIQADAGKTSLAAQNEKAVWAIEKIANSTDVRIKHLASGGYLNAETDAKFPMVGAIQPGWLSAMWILEPVAGTELVRIKNKWRGLYLHTESGALEMGAIQPGWWSAQWQVFRSSSVSTNTPSGVQNGWVTFFNEAGYVAKYTLTYMLDGQPQVFSTGSIALGSKRRFDIPGRATNIAVKGEADAVVSWKSIFEKTFTSPPNQCFKTFGAIFSPQWNNNCE